jgi:putative SOS response-associated peptidase YedK
LRRSSLPPIRAAEPDSSIFVQWLYAANGSTWLLRFAEHAAFRNTPAIAKKRTLAWMSHVISAIFDHRFRTSRLQRSMNNGKWGRSMCGRFLLRCPPENWPAELLGEDDNAEPNRTAEYSFVSRSNIAPTQMVLAIFQAHAGAPRTLRPFRWGLIPPWADDPKIGSSMINARAETVDQKPSFKSAFSQRRVLIPADGYYEWVKKDDKTKQPMLIERPGRELFCFAGLWEHNDKIGLSELAKKQTAIIDENEASQTPIKAVSMSGASLTTCTIITTAANESMAGIHDRMPVVIDASDYRRWLDPNYRDTESLKSLLRAAADDYFTVTPVQRVTGA